MTQIRYGATLVGTSRMAPMASPRVLVVDDEPDIRVLLQMTLGLDGFDVVGEATNGQEAVAMASDLQPDVIVLDLMMPVMSGMEALPLIMEQSPRSHVVVLSAAASHLMDQAVAAGADGCVEKPVAIRDLAPMLHSVCSN